MRLILLIYLITSLFCGIRGQNQIVPLNNQWGYSFEKNLYEKQDENFHPGIKPYLKSNLVFIQDSFLDFGFKASSKFRITPLVNTSSKIQTHENALLGFGIGSHFQYNPHKKIGISGFYRFTKDPRFNYLENSYLIHNTVNGIGINQGNQTAHHWEGYINYNPNQYFNITAGNGKNFWGDGYRSMMISDFSAPAPFLRIASNFWNIQYTNLYSMYTDTQYDGNFRRKFSTSHQISWNISKNLNFTVFESVIFSGSDSLTSRGFDVNYLNPIIFYRPVEYAQGSADNVLLGTSLRYTFLDKYTFYGQGVLDEFVIEEYRNNNGWWANKYAAQVGFKTFDLLNIKGLGIQTELNWVRPFTFAHGTSVLNYGHLSQSLAHPLGANFHEWINRIRFARGKWYGEFKAIYIDRGADSYSDAISYGSNIFESYTWRTSEYGHTMGQGIKQLIWHLELKGSYMLVPKINLRLYGSVGFRNLTLSPNNSINNGLFQFGITSSLWNTYEDF